MINLIVFGKLITVPKKNICHWASKSAKAQLKKTCWTTIGNLDQCAIDMINIDR